MKRLVRYLALSLVLIACIAIPVYAQDKPVTITLLHVNDTHSHLDATGPKDWHLDGTTGGMGDLITDAMRNKTHTDIALTVNGLISEGIPRGLVVGADIFRPVSYGYDVPTGLGLKLATFQIKALDLIKGLEIGLAYLGIDEDYFVQVSGMRFQYDASQPPFQRIVLSSVFINGKPLDLAKSYTVTANTGLVSLLPLMGVPVQILSELPDLEYIVLRNYIQHLVILFYPSMGRIEDISVHGK
jgi:2',3'-cyclic-nucleotide 2'-phosphodiesterase (5'-nucleotidase family)